MKKTRLILLFSGLLLLILPFLYHPVKENQIYQRSVKLPEVSEISEEALGDDKMIQLAKNTLENMFGVSIDEEAYDINVEYETSHISNYVTNYVKQNLTFANIVFKDKEFNEMKYLVTCDATNGEILTLIQQYTSPWGDSYKQMEELREAAKSFLEKMTQISSENILYLDDKVQGSTYIANITVKETYEHIIIYADAFDGTVFYYLKAKEY